MADTSEWGALGESLPNGSTITKIEHSECDAHGGYSEYVEATYPTGATDRYHRTVHGDTSPPAVRRALRAGIADARQDFENFLALDKPTGQEALAQLRHLTETMVALIRLEHADFYAYESEPDQ